MRSFWLIGSTFIGLCSTVMMLLALAKPAHAATAPASARAATPFSAQLGSSLQLPTLSFAIVGACRPPFEDDVAGYPSAVQSQIWKDVAAANPAFAVTTGDYLFAAPTKTPSTVGTQIGLFLTAQSNYKGNVYHAMGGMECDGAATDNCGVAGTSGGITPNYQGFISQLAPSGQTLPYYVLNFHGPGNAWTAKFVVVAANAWSTAQATWLGNTLAVPTTYTFIVCNAPTTETTAPCWAAKGSTNLGTIIAQYPYTLFIAGHTHTYEYLASSKEVIVGNGGAPLSGIIDYGYVIAKLQSNKSITFTAYDYSTNAVQGTFTVQ